MARHRASVLATIEQLEQAQDDLLDRLIAGGRLTDGRELRQYRPRPCRAGAVLAGEPIQRALEEGTIRCRPAS